MKRSPFDVVDVLALTGIAILGWALALIWLPLAGVVVGSAILIYAFMAALPPKEKRP
jgi:hypothetical protein